MVKQTSAQTEAPKGTSSPEAIRKQLVLTGADIVQLGESAELLVGGKNYNTAIISEIKEMFDVMRQNR